MTSSRPGASYVRRPELQAVEMDGELVMMGQEQGEYFAMRDVAASIWQYLEENRSLEDLVRLVADEYDVSAETCRDDIVAFLDDLVGRKLVTAS